MHYKSNHSVSFHSKLLYKVVRPPCLNTMFWYLNVQYSNDGIQTNGKHPVIFLQNFKMFQFCFRVLLLKKFLRRVHKYPVYVSPEDSLPTATTANGGIGLTNGYSGSSSGPGAARHLYDMVQFF